MRWSGAGGVIQDDGGLPDCMEEVMGSQSPAGLRREEMALKKLKMWGCI